MRIETIQTDKDTYYTGEAISVSVVVNNDTVVYNADDGLLGMVTGALSYVVAPITHIVTFPVLELRQWNSSTNTWSLITSVDMGLIFESVYFTRETVEFNPISINKEGDVWLGVTIKGGSTYPEDSAMVNILVSNTVTDSASRATNTSTTVDFDPEDKLMELIEQEKVTTFSSFVTACNSLDLEYNQYASTFCAACPSDSVCNELYGGYSLSDTVTTGVDDTSAKDSLTQVWDLVKEKATPGNVVAVSVTAAALVSLMYVVKSRRSNNYERV